MQLEIPIIVGFDNLESLLDDLKKLQTYKLFEGDEMVLVDIEDVAEVLMKHVKAKKSVKSDDLISRADALSCFHDWIDQRGDVHTADEMPEYQRIEELPSAQPEIKPIGYKECCLAMMRMWMDNVLTDGEYMRIMNKLNDFERGKANERSD